MVNQDRIVQEFLELVQIDSAPGQERQLADALKAKLEALGLEVVEDSAGEAIDGNAGNVIARLPGKVKNAPTIAFAAHMDRVSPGFGIKPQVKDGIIYSDGTTILAADDVAGIVQMLEAVRVLAEQEIEHGDIELLFTISEEAGLQGAKNLDRSLLRAQAAYFLDGGGDVGTIIPAAPAQKKITVKVNGVPAHAGIEPEKGVSAIVVAADAITRMNLGRIDEETTCNIGTIRGGVATNIIPEEVVLLCEVRSRNEQKLQAQVDHMVNEFENAATRFGVSVDIDIEESYPAMNLSEDDQAVQLVVEAVKAMGLTPNLVPTGGGSDANILVGKGLPSVILGIGMEKVHSTEESISIEQLVAGAELVVAIAQAAAKV
ncbi:MAG: M20/M25/M40 family metallo-hydrolase [Firmicutes bacterium]|nr:M20/M25/M40 family metallo-hydrolase [Bacillota bacterium]